MDSNMDVASRRPMERTPSMPGGFPNYLEVPPRQRSRSRPAASSDTDTTYNNNTPSSQPKPPKGILKNSPNRQQDERLAARFYRLQRPVQTHQAPPHSPMHSPTFYASDSTYGGFEGETDVNSTSSELSVNTQATSVASVSDFSDVKRGRPSVHIRHVRPVPIPTTGSRVRARPRTRPPSEVSRSEITKGPSQTSGKRTVHIQIVPSKPAPPEPQSMQLARIPTRELVREFEQLSGAENERYERRQLVVRRQDNVSEELRLENKQIVRDLNRERNTKELILRDLEEQRKLFDEFRSNFEWQQSVLMEVEKERDSLRQAHSDAEKKLVDLEKDISEREQKQQEQDELLRQQITKLGIATTTLEEKVLISDQKLKSLATERDDLQALSQQYEVQINVLKEITKPSEDERQAAEQLRQKLQLDLDTVTERNRKLRTKSIGLVESIVALRAQITDFEVAKKDLENTLASERASKGDLERSLLADKGEAVKQLLADKDQLIAEKEELEKQLIAEKEELVKELEATKDDLGKQLQATKDDLEKQLEDTKNESEKQLEDTKNESGKQLEATKNELGKQLEDTKLALEAQLEAHKAEREELQQKIDAGEAARDDLEKQLAAAKEELGKEIADAKDDLEQRGAAWQAEKDDKQSTIDGLITELAGAKNANVALATQRLEVERQLTEVEANLATVQAELTDLQATHKTLESDNEQLKTQNSELAQQRPPDLDKLQGKHAELDEKISSLLADLDAAQAARA
ncbi:hypothetical protein NUW58_g9876 [Xylaria curta]|uniref:Uncharacterized protein n=1 Tax=Xylaria curta TaxID=42375 RepID=A0ACC1MUB7_9PEZI|nr:hypothetical protein NUW58_g9876 [Xylaria curta]